jgi:SMC interacting uncharacterized protein involved in chromosome segregation
MKLLKGTMITKLKREVEIKGEHIKRLQAKRDLLNKDIEDEINEVSEISALIADNEAKEPAFEVSAVGKSE